MKRGIPIFIAFLLLSTLAISFVSAADEGTDEIVESIKGFFTPILTALFGSTENLFEELLFALLIIAFVYMALERVSVMRNNSFALWTSTIVIAVLVVRFIATEGLVELLLLPQGAMGIAMLTIIPFAIYFWFVEFGIDSRILRKFAWAVYGVVWAFIWYKQVYKSADPVLSQWGYIYLISAILAGILILLDSQVRQAMKRIKAEKALTPGKYIHYNRLMKDREDTQEAYLDAVKRGDTSTATSLQEQVKNLDKAIAIAMP